MQLHETELLLHCNTCAKTFDGQYAAETHALEEGHVEYTDITGSTATNALVHAPSTTTHAQCVYDKPAEEAARSHRDAQEKAAKLRDMEKRNLRIKKQKEDNAKESARILANIAADKKRRDSEKSRRIAFLKSAESGSARSVSTLLQEEASCNKEVRLKLRVVGVQECIEEGFPIESKLSAVAELVHQKLYVTAAGFKTSFPKKEFRGADFDSTLEELGLVYSTVLIVIEAR
ncbi:Ubx domain-containing protein [Pyrenophora teres f. maculata]|nr:Ubx domain-containing protein [Pyrenophora teres f. maculata]